MTPPATTAPLDPRLARILSPAERDAVMAPIAQAMTLPATAYAGEAWYRLELERVFARHWLAAAFACELPAPGDAHPSNLCDGPPTSYRPLTAIAH